MEQTHDVTECFFTVTFENRMVERKDVPVLSGRFSSAHPRITVKHCGCFPEYEKRILACENTWEVAEVMSSVQGDSRFWDKRR